MDKDTRDQVLGMLYGHIIGDTIGSTMRQISLNATDSDKDKLAKLLDTGDFASEWSSSTDIMLFMMGYITEQPECLIGEAIKVFLSDAANVPHMYKKMPPVMKHIFLHENYTDDSLSVSREIWEKSNRTFATSECIVRSSILGCLPSESECAQSSQVLAQCTHYDARCAAACILYTLLLRGVIYSDAADHNMLTQILHKSVDSARKYIGEQTDPVHKPNFASLDEELSHWVKTAFTDHLSKLEISSLKNVGYVFKCLGCAIYTLQVLKMAVDTDSTPSFKKIMIKIASEGEFADANCAVSGAILGAFLGYAKLPQDWIGIIPSEVEKILKSFAECDLSMVKVRHQ